MGALYPLPQIIRPGRFKDLCLRGARCSFRFSACRIAHAIAYDFSAQRRSLLRARHSCVHAQRKGRKGLLESTTAFLGLLCAFAVDIQPIRGFMAPLACAVKSI